MDEHDFEVVDKMSIYGGSFVKALAECFYNADPINFAKLKNTFAEYWKQYEAMVKPQKNGLKTQEEKSA